MEERDIETVWSIEQRTQKEPWSRQTFLEELRHFPPRFFVIESQVGPGAPQVVGFGGCRCVTSESYVLNLGVDPAYQRKGLGKALLSFLVERSRKEGCSVMHLDVRADNEEAIRFYKSLGFCPAGIRPRAYPDGTDGWVLKKDLQ